MTAAPALPLAAPAKRTGMGVLSAVTAVVVWGTSSVLIKEVDGLNGVAISAYRLWIGAVLISAVFLLSGGRVTWALLRLSFWGAIAFLADIILFFSALQETSVANATVIGALQPLLMLAVAGPLFGERPRWTDGAWGCVAVAGAALVVLGGDGGGVNSAAGNLLAVGALAAWTWYFIASKTARTRLTSFEYLTGISIVSALVVIPVPFLLDQPLGSPTGEAWALIAAIAVINGALGHFLMNWSHAHIPLVAMSLLTLGIPVVSAASAALFIDEPLVAIQVVGMAVVVGALGVVSVHGARRTPHTAEDEGQAVALVPEP
ncbi:MAG: DMT family transporter [Acidimicrobiales bacterium]|nr:DMT family transporter [Acidimicrobiales bacterium]